MIHPVRLLAGHLEQLSQAKWNLLCFGGQPRQPIQALATGVACAPPDDDQANRPSASLQLGQFARHHHY